MYRPELAWEVPLDPGSTDPASASRYTDGFWLARHRFYDPGLGRWITRDPAGYVDGMNLYLYVSGDPMGAVDPYGLFANPFAGLMQMVGGAVRQLKDAARNAVGGWVSPTECPTGVPDQVNAVRNSDSVAYGILADAAPAIEDALIDGGIGAAQVAASTIPGIGEGLTLWETVNVFSDPTSTYGDYALVSADVTASVASLGGLPNFSPMVRGGGRMFRAAGTIGQAVEQASDAARASRRVPPSAYSVAFEMRLRGTSYPGLTRARHFQEANTALIAAMESSPAFARQARDIGINMSRSPAGVVPRTSPVDWTWHHHANDPGLLQLVPHNQHRPGSEWQELLHPGGRGGYATWGK